MLRRAAATPYLRREFTLGEAVRRATLYATARGLVELRLNGTRVGDAVLAPGWTDYRTRIEYAAHDVTVLVRDGDNELAAILGEGWYAGHVGFDIKRAGAHYGTQPQLLCELHVEHEAGQRPWSLPTTRGTRRPARSCTPTCSTGSATTLGANPALGGPSPPRRSTTWRSCRSAPSQSA
jgi:hypothetical protein